ncbi:hypothetical protein [Henriciella marina]|uniref:hypothetical protein n=1 Tax=Henriciella marina TaxID=453851 RepID=UPI00036E0AEA|nr:hypothetical protein [Henriciella marina]
MNNNAEADTVLTGLLDILETEHEALKAGAAGKASGLLQPKMEAMNAFDELMADPAQLRGVPDVKSRMERIVRLATENAELFSAVRNGVGQAVSRIGGATSNAYVGAYTSAGGKTAFSKAAGGYAKKA